MIIHLLLGSSPGGIEVLIPPIINGSSELKPKVYVIYDKAVPGQSVFDNTEIKPYIGKKTFIKSAIVLVRFARDNYEQIFQAYNIGPIFLILLRVAGVKRIIYCVHGTIYWKTPIQKVIRKLLWNIALTKNIRLLSNTNYSGQRFKEQIWNKAQPVTIYNPIDIVKYYFKKELPNRPQSVIYVGRLATGKNLILWLDIALYLSKHYPEMEFHIYGAGAIRENLEEYSLKIGIADKVAFHGFVREIEQTYRAGDLLIFLSDHESFGNVVVESILSGTPVICSNIPSMWEIFENYPDFLIGLEDNVQEQVLSKINNYKNLSELTKKAQVEFRDKFTIENHIAKLKDIYESF